MVQEKYGKNEIEVPFGEEKIKITEKELWRDIFVKMGNSPHAVQILKSKYPKVFELFQKQDEKLRELKTFIRENFGFDYEAMTIVDQINLTLALIKYAGILPKNENVS